ncbi:hypothetical protein L1987_43009 [Smallanthus sonchifolius]|uniref:Uncharacterized protein n=1 Tax=Smallanthus sonchifolius TaxID=185202 RepID=A0ACB9GLH5_9ASTR|nr:hypothetical protein L1987_43009 [Smallanthus sonchifolius]
MDAFPVESSSTSGYLEVEVMLASRNPKKRSGRKKLRRHDTRVWLGTYPTAEMAARAHHVAVLAMRGRSACLNFADSVWRLPVPESSNVKDIQKAAVEAFRQTEAVVETEEMKEIVCYVDDEEMFGMPGFLDSMAEGLMVPPPQTVGHDNFLDNVEIYIDMSLSF